MAVTLNQIARKAKLSIPSVSRALAGHPTMSSQTIERVQAIGRQLGYQPPRGWRNREAARPRRVTLVMVTRGPGAIADDLAGSATAHAAQAQNLRLELRAIRCPIESESLVGQFREIAAECDGLILYGPVRLDELAELSAAGVPFVMLGNPYGAGAAPSQPPAGIVVASDYVDMGRIATQRLIDRGHRQICFVGGKLVPGMWYDSWLKGYWLAHLESGLVPNAALQLAGLAEDPGEWAREVTRRLNSMASPPTAAVITDDSWAPDFRNFMREHGTDMAPADMTFGARWSRVQGGPLERWPLVAEDIDAMIEVAFAQIRLPLDGAPMRSARILLPHKTYNFE